MSAFTNNNTTTLTNSSAPIFTVVSQADDPVLRSMYQVPMSSLLSPQIVLGIRTIHETANKFSKWKKTETFILFLQQIKYWNERLVEQEVDRIKMMEPNVETLYYDFLNNLLRKITGNYKLTYKELKGSYYMKLRDYIHRVYMDVAEKIILVNGDLLHLNDYTKTACEQQLMRIIAIDKINKLMDQFATPPVALTSTTNNEPSIKATTDEQSKHDSVLEMSEHDAVSQRSERSVRDHDEPSIRSERSKRNDERSERNEPSVRSERSKRNDEPSVRSERSERNEPSVRSERSKRNDERSVRGRDETSEFVKKTEKSERSQKSERTIEEPSIKSYRKDEDVTEISHNPTYNTQNFKFKRPQVITTNSRTATFLSSLNRPATVTSSAVNRVENKTMNKMSLRELSEAVVNDFERSEYSRILSSSSESEESSDDSNSDSDHRNDHHRSDHHRNDRHRDHRDHRDHHRSDHHRNDRHRDHRDHRDRRDHRDHRDRRDHSESISSGSTSVSHLSDARSLMSARYYDSNNKSDASKIKVRI